MTAFCGAYFVPHPPIIVESVGRGREKPAADTIEAYRRMAEELAALKPEIIVLLTPHGSYNAREVRVTTAESAHGSMAEFGAPHTGLSFTVAQEEAESFVLRAQEKGLPLVADSYGMPLDHGAFVPLWFIHRAGLSSRLVHMVTGDPFASRSKEIGALLAQEASGWGKRTALVVSGDLSHCLKREGPYGYRAAGMDFEEKFDALIRAGDVAGILSFDAQTLNDAAQCGMAPLFIALSALGRIKPEVYSHEWPFGVGYMVANLCGGEKG